MTSTLRTAACALLLTLVAGGLSAQPISVSVAPRSTSSAGEPVYFTVTPHVEPGFTAGVYLSVASPTIPARLLVISPGYINAPYTDQGSVKVSFDASVANGRHLIIVEGHNGPATSYDTAAVVLQATRPVRVFTAENSPLPSNSARVLAVNHDGVGWIATDRGLVTFDGTTWTAQPVDTASQIPMQIFGGTVGSDNSTWLVGWDLRRNGTPTCLSRYVNGAWTTTWNDELYMNGSQGCIAADSSGNVWLAMRFKLARYDGTSWTTYDLDDARVVAIGRENKVWAGINGGVPLHSFDGTYWSEFQPGFWQVAPQGNVRAVGVDRNNAVWMLGDRGISTMDSSGHVRTFYNSDTNFPGPHPYVFAFDQTGAMWIGDQLAGLTRYDGTTAVHYTMATAGLSSNQITSIAVGPDTTIWAGLGGQGVVIIDGKGFPKPSSVAIEDRGASRGSIRSIAPNPATGDRAALELSAERPGNAVVSLFDGLGRRATAPIALRVELGTQTLDLPLDGVPAGVYLVSVALDGHVATSRLVVAR